MFLIDGGSGFCFLEGGYRADYSGRFLQVLLRRFRAKVGDAFHRFTIRCCSFDSLMKTCVALTFDQFPLFIGGMFLNECRTRTRFDDVLCYIGLHFASLLFEKNTDQY